MVDAIVIYPRCHGTLTMPGEWSTDNRPPAHEILLTSGDRDNHGVDYGECLLGAPNHYLLTYDVWNHRDSTGPDACFTGS